MYTCIKCTYMYVHVQHVHIHIHVYVHVYIYMYICFEWSERNLSLLFFLMNNHDMCTSMCRLYHNVWAHILFENKINTLSFWPLPYITLIIGS